MLSQFWILDFPVIIFFFIFILKEIRDTCMRCQHSRNCFVRDRTTPLVFIVELPTKIQQRIGNNFICFAAFYFFS